MMENESEEIQNVDNLPSATRLLFLGSGTSLLDGEISLDVKGR